MVMGIYTLHISHQLRGGGVQFTETNHQYQGCFPFSQNFQFKWKGLFPPRNRVSFFVVNLINISLVNRWQGATKQNGRQCCSSLDLWLSHQLWRANWKDSKEWKWFWLCVLRSQILNAHSKVSNYFADEFAAHFRMTQTTAELLTREVIHTGRIPLGNPEKQVLIFLWALEMAGTISPSCKWNSMFLLQSVATKKMEQLRRLSICSGKFPLEPPVPAGWGVH